MQISKSAKNDQNKRKTYCAKMTQTCKKRENTKNPHIFFFFKKKNMSFVRPKGKNEKKKHF
jgi:phage-related protein